MGYSIGYGALYEYNEVSLLWSLVMIVMGASVIGGAIGFFNGNIKKLNEDVLLLKPTVFVGVPRVYQRFYEAAAAKIAAFSGLKKTLVSYLLESETAYARTGRHTIYGKILAKALGAKFDYNGCKKWYVPAGMDPTPFARWL